MEKDFVSAQAENKTFSFQRKKKYRYFQGTNEEKEHFKESYINI
jgi:hypothetical protein